MSAAATPAPARACYGLVVGIGRYQDPKIPTLRFTGADAQAFYDHLVAPERAGFSADKVRLLLNEQATRRNIEKSISGWLFQNVGPDSTVVVFFAGHGGLESDKTGTEKDGVSKYLLPWDADPDDLFASGLSNTRFHELLNTIKAQRLVVFMDACYAGGVTEGARDIGLVESPYHRMAEGRGRMVIASAQPNQRSWEDEMLGHGIFTYHLLEALQGKADTDNDGCASVMDIFRYLQETVPATARRVSQSLQEPLLFGDQISKEVVLTVNCQLMMEFARRKREAERLLGERIKQNRQKLFSLHEGGGLPLQAFSDAMSLLEKDPGSQTPDERRRGKLLEALLDDKIPLDVYLAFADTARPVAPPAVPPEYRRHQTQPAPDPPASAPASPEVRYCINCGARVIAGNKFCINCGRPYRKPS
jgi:Caspase domain/zinc-ribbon domain